MKTNDKKVKDFDTVEVFRKIKTKISAEIKDLSFDQLTAYLDKNKLVRNPTN